MQDKDEYMEDAPSPVALFDKEEEDQEPQAMEEDSFEDAIGKKSKTKSTKKKSKKKKQKNKDKETDMPGEGKKKKKRRKLKKRKKEKSKNEDVSEIVDAALTKLQEEAPKSKINQATPEELEAERIAQAEIEERRAILRELQTDDQGLKAQATARRLALAEKIKQRLRAEEEAKARAARLQLIHDDDSDSDLEIEIIGAPTTEEKQQQLNSHQYSTTQHKTKKAFINPRKALGLQLKQRVRRSCLEHFTKHAALGTTDPDAYFRHLQALEAQRCLKMKNTSHLTPADEELSTEFATRCHQEENHIATTTTQQVSNIANEQVPAEEYDELDSDTEGLFTDTKSQSLKFTPASGIIDCNDSQSHDEIEKLPNIELNQSQPSEIIEKCALVNKEDRALCNENLFDDSQPLEFTFPASASLHFPDSPPDEEAQENHEQQQKQQQVPRVIESVAHQESVAEESSAIDKSGNTFKDNQEETQGESKQVKSDRAAAYRAMLERDAQAAKNKHWALDAEAEESDDEFDGQRGLGDFGFGVPEIATKKDDKEKEDLVATAEDFEAIVDELSDDEKGDEDAAETLNFAYAKQREREEMAEMLRSVREGFDARGRGLGDRAATTTLGKLVELDAKAKREAKRLGLDDDADDDDNDVVGTNDEEGKPKSDADAANDQEEEEVDEEAAFAEMISNEIKQRHLGAAALRRKRRELEEDSSDDDDDEPESSQQLPPAEDSDEEIEREAEARSKAWAKRVKRRRQLEKAEAQRRARDPRDVAKSLLDRDENSQFILGILQRDSREDSVSGFGDFYTKTNNPRAPSRNSSLQNDDPTLFESSSSSLPQTSSNTGSQRRNEFNSSSRIGPRAASFFRSNSLLADAAGPIASSSTYRHQPQKGPSASASGRLVTSHRPAVVFDVSSNSNSAFPNDHPHPNKRKATPPIRRLDPNIHRKPCHSNRDNKKPRFDATASIWSHVAVNRFG
uniref:DNA replication checkpoint mediator MRC1 domain-containing protein n=1 Tax=Aureoumbra lagunensis TaxID=44058 RepID=A0A7S3K3Z9_9STRA